VVVGAVVIAGLILRRHRTCTPEIARAATSRWISDVPSKIWQLPRP